MRVDRETGEIQLADAGRAHDARHGQALVIASPCRLTRRCVRFVLQAFSSHFVPNPKSVVSVRPHAVSAATMQTPTLERRGRRLWRGKLVECVYSYALYFSKVKHFLLFSRCLRARLVFQRAFAGRRRSQSNLLPGWNDADVSPHRAKTDRQDGPGARPRTRRPPRRAKNHKKSEKSKKVIVF